MKHPKPDVVDRSSGNENVRNRGVWKIQGVIIHHTGDTRTSGLVRYFTRANERGVSCHYLIAPDGTIYQIVRDELAAMHAGKATFRGTDRVNEITIGIELVHDGQNTTPFPDEQISALERLSLYLAEQYGLTASDFVGHAEVAPGRKFDPAKTFPWKRFRETLAAG